LIGDGLDRYPGLILDRVEWMANTDPNFGSGGTHNDSAPIVNANINTTGQLPAGDYFQIAVLEGHFNNFDGDYRKAIAMVNSFTETLRREDSIYNVSVLDFPLDISSTASLQGNTKAVVKEAKFTIRVVMVINNET